MKAISAGFLIKSDGRFLICHITQDPGYVYSEKDPFWSIPKGIVESKEHPLETAIRELEEETGIDLSDIIINGKLNISLFHQYESRSKVYKIYLYEDTDGKLIKKNFTCKSIIESKAFPLRNGLPEHDMFKWVTAAEGKALVFDSLKHVFDLKAISSTSS